MELVVRLRAIGGTPVLDLHGEVDLATIPKLYGALTTLERSIGAGCPTAVVDIDGVYALDDSGLGVLLGAAGRFREADSNLVVVCSPGALRARLARTGFDRAVRVVASVADATKAVPAAEAGG